MVIRKGNKHQLGLFFLLEACQRNGAGWSTAVWPANAKLPLPHRRSSITRPCCSIERSSAKLRVFTCPLKFERSTGSERVNALGPRAVEVIICMITRDFSVISMTAQASLSLYLSQKSLTHNIGSASALPIMWVNAIWFWTDVCACKPKLRVNRVRTKRKMTVTVCFASGLPVSKLKTVFKNCF